MLRGSSSNFSVVSLLQNGIPFILPSSGSVAAATGVITLTTALDAVYSQAYMYFPAGAFTGSVAGYYYVTMSSTTVGVMTTSRYTGGVPTVPSAPVTVTTGVGAYVQDTGVTVAQTIVIPAGSMGLNSRIYSESSGSCPNSAGAKSFSVIFGGSNLGAAATTTSVAVIMQNRIANMGAANKQSYINNNIITAGANVGVTAIDTTADVNFSIGMQIVTATDFLICKYVFIEITR